MKFIRFSDIERKIFKAIANKVDLNTLSDISEESKISAVKRLAKYDLIKSVVNYTTIIDIAITAKGLAYLEQNPNLSNPIDDEIKKLQLDELEHKKRIRTQEDIIRYWKLSTVIVGILGSLGWLLFVFVRFFN